MANIEEISDINVFFYYGTLDDEIETEHNLMSALYQPERTYFYNRSDSVGIVSYENQPNNLILQIQLRFQIANWVNFYNSYTGDGTGLSKERRIAVSQFSVMFYQMADNLDMEILYIPFSDYTQVKSIRTGIGVGQ